MTHHTRHPHDAAAFSLPVRVYYQDTDAGGVVYHSKYLDFMERARYEWLREMGCGVAELTERDQVIFVIRAAKVDYHRPALLDDLLDVTASVHDLGRARVGIHQEVRRGDELLTSARIDVVCIAADSRKPVAIPQALRDRFESTKGAS